MPQTVPQVSPPSTSAQNSSSSSNNGRTSNLPPAAVQHLQHPTREPSNPHRVPSIPSLKRTISGGSIGNNVRQHPSSLSLHPPPAHHHHQHPPQSNYTIPHPSNMKSGGGAGGNHNLPGGQVSYSSSSIGGGQARQDVAGSSVPPTISRAVTSSGAYNRPSPRFDRPESKPMQNNSHHQSQFDWRTFITIEERQAVRSKIRDSYTNTCRSYDELLQTVSAIEEELLHISAPSRLDYFKSGFEFENRVKLKKDQMQGHMASTETRKKRGLNADSEGKNEFSRQSPSRESALKKQR